MLEFLKLDTQTLLFGAALLSFLFAAAAVLASRAFVSKEMGLQSWGWSNIMAGTAFCLYLFRDIAPPVITYGLSNVLMLAGVAFNVKAHAGLLGNSLPQHRVWWIVAAGSLGLLPTLIAGAPRILGLITHSSAMAILMAWVFLLIWRDPRSRTLVARASMVLMSVMAVAFMLRGAGAISRFISGAPESLGAARPIGLLAFGAMFVVAASFGFFWLVSERHRREVLAAAQRDGLTGLYTRAIFFEMAEEIASTPGSTYAVVMVDIDHFKQVNDRHGHQGGDLVLAHAARLVATEARVSDLAGRYGGEEFCVVLRDCNADQAHDFATRLVAQARLQSVRLRSGESCQYTVSAGSAAAFTHAGTAPSLADIIEQADRALYAAKHAGRNRAMRASAPTLHSDTVLALRTA